jgi:hypothetical protein
MAPDSPLIPHWFSLFGEIERLIEANDCVVLDGGFDDVLRQRLEAATPNVHHYRLGDMEETRAQICNLRNALPAGRIFVLASIRDEHRAAPSEMWRLQEACHRYGAILLVESSGERA